jgi:hypothetical protein
VFELLAAAEKPVAVLGFEIGQTSEVGDAQEEWLTLVLKRVTGAPTSGSGGGTSTFIPRLPNDVAASATLETGNTTKLTGGTSAELARIPWQVRQSALWRPTPEEIDVIAGGTRAVLELVTTPADSISAVVGWLSIAELA